MYTGELVVQISHFCFRLHKHKTVKKKNNLRTPDSYKEYVFSPLQTMFGKID